MTFGLGCACGLETYYRMQIGRWVQGSSNPWHIRNSGYRHERGPATIIGFRINTRY